MTYRQSPDEIDFADLWVTNPGMAKMELRVIAPGHRRLEMVAHGFGEWWIGPGLNDFDESLIKACQKRKRKFQQPDSVGDAKTFINNMLKSGDWGNFSLRCDEARTLQERMRYVDRQAARDVADNSSIASVKTLHNPIDSARLSDWPDLRSLRAIIQELGRLLLYATFRMKLLDYKKMECVQSWAHKIRELQ